MAEKENLTRWVWDLFPLSNDTWGAWQLADDENRPDQRVFIRRYQGDGYLSPPVSMDMLARMMEQGHASEDFAQREGYVPTQEDVDLLKRQYSNSDPYQPVWRAIKSDLVAAGHVPDSMQGYDVPTLLGLLKRSETPDAPEDDETKTASPKRKKVGRTAAACKEIKSRPKLAGRESTDAINKNGEAAEILPHGKLNRELRDRETPAPPRPEPAEAELSEIDRLEQTTPPLNKQSGEWVMAHEAARIEHIKLASLTTYRNQGEKTDDGLFGLDPNQRVWRKETSKRGNPTHTVYYLKSSLELAE